MVKYEFVGAVPLDRPVKLILPIDLPRPVIFPRKLVITLRGVHYGTSFAISEPDRNRLRILLRKYASLLPEDQAEKALRWIEQGKTHLNYIVFRGTRTNGLYPWIVYLYLPPGYSAISSSEPSVLRSVGRHYEMRGAVTQHAFYAYEAPRLSRRELKEQCIREFTAEHGRAPTKRELKQYFKIARRYMIRRVSKIKFLFLPYVEGRGWPTLRDMKIAEDLSVGLESLIQVGKAISHEIVAGPILRERTKMYARIIDAQREQMHAVEDEMVTLSERNTSLSRMLAAKEQPIEVMRYHYPGDIKSLPKPYEEPPKKPKEPLKISPTLLFLAMLLFGFIITGAGIWVAYESSRPQILPSGQVIQQPANVLPMVGGIILIILSVILLYLESRKAEAPPPPVPTPPPPRPREEVGREMERERTERAETAPTAT